MIKELSYRNKNRILLTAIALLSIVSWQFAFKKTIELKNTCEVLEGKLRLASDAPQKTAEIKKKLESITRMLNGQEAANTTQHDLMGIVTKYCQEHPVVLREFPKSTVSRESGVQVESNIITVEGNFRELLQLVYVLEQKHRAGSVASVNFQVNKNSRTKFNSLTAEIYVQHAKI